MGLFTSENKEYYGFHIPNKVEENSPLESGVLSIARLKLLSHFNPHCDHLRIQLCYFDIHLLADIVHLTVR